MVVAATQSMQRGIEKEISDAEVGRPVHGSAQSIAALGAWQIRLLNPGVVRKWGQGGFSTWFSGRR